MDLSAYKLTIVGVIGVIILGGALVLVLGGPATAAPYLTLISSVAVPGLLALLRSDQNAAKIDQVAAQNKVQHVQNQQKINLTDQKIDALAQALNDQKETTT